MKFSDLCQIDQTLVYGGMVAGAFGCAFFMLLEVFISKAWYFLKRLVYYAFEYYHNRNNRNKDK